MTYAEKECCAIAAPMVECITCKHILPVNKFWKQRNDNPQNVCKDCYRERNKKWVNKNPEKVKSYAKKWNEKNPNHTHKHKLKYRYGLTLEDYNKKLLEQDGVCAICNRPETIRKNLCVDHNHSTGQIRGLLCDSCNKSLGGFNDSEKTLLDAINYLKGYKNG